MVTASQLFLTWDEIGVEHAWPALGSISGTLAAHREEEDALAGTDLDTGWIAHSPV